ncbi:hypothetical protein GQ53DRAFT_882998 [Thozetella sp. PMI_491]|nr:hypothetical protein GQ53DRAFT_882998 [Thozetella sp. PMI_491]
MKSFALVFFMTVAAAAPRNDTTITKDAVAVQISVDIGTFHSDWIGWLNGNDPCDIAEAGVGPAWFDGRKVDDSKENPCGKKFKPYGAETFYTWEGCGGDTWLNFADGRTGFAGSCRSTPRVIGGCGFGSSVFAQYQCIVSS